jgi:hypothetical protein
MREIIVALLIAMAACGSALAQAFTVQLGDKSYHCEEVFFDTFEQGLGNWLAEGDATIGVNQGWLDVDARFGDVGAVTIWCKKEFSGPQVVEYDVRLMASTIQSNINIFLLASMPEGPSLLETSDTHNGSYSQYHVFPNYLITVLNGTHPQGKRTMLRLRMRQNPGFRLIEEGWFEPLLFGKVYHISYLIQPPKVAVFLDGRKLGEATYGEKLMRGYHGLRIWHTHSIYDNFRVSRVKE